MTTVSGTETTVNTTTAGNQTYNISITLDNGRYVAIWYANDGSAQGQIFNADGSRFGAELPILSGVSSQSRSAAALANGGWVMSYETIVDGKPTVYVQQYNDDGTAHGDPTMVMALNQGRSAEPDIAALTDGGWVVTWTSLVGAPDIYVQRYAADGTEVGQEVQVSDDYGNNRPKSTSSVIGTADGGWKVTWLGLENNYPARVTSQMFSADGSKWGVNSLVGDTETTLATTASNHVGPSEWASLADGNNVVTWMLNGQIRYQIQNANPFVSDINGTASAPGLPYGELPKVTALDSGGFVIVWDVENSGGTYFQVLNADGSKNGEAVLVGGAGQTTSGISALSGGRWVITWTDDQGGDLDIHQQIFSLVNEAPAGTDHLLHLPGAGGHQFTAAEFGFSDVNNNTLLGIVISKLPDQGTLTLNNVVVSIGDTIAVADISKLMWTIPNGGGDYIDTLKFQVRDNGGTLNGGSDTDPTANTITLSVGDVNLAPSGADKVVTINEDHGYTFQVADFGFAEDAGQVIADNFAKVLITGIVTAGSLKLNGVAVAEGQAINAADIANLVYTPAADQSGDNSLVLKFKVVDDGGTNYGGVDTDQTENTLTFNVLPVNDAPISKGDVGISTDISDGLNYTFKAADFLNFIDREGDTITKVIIDGIAGEGTFRLGDDTLVAGQTIDIADVSRITLTGSPQAAGNHAASLTFRVMDDGGTQNGGSDISGPATIFVNFTDMPNAPVGADATVKIREDMSYTFSADVFGMTDPRDHPADDLLAVAVAPVSGQGKFMLGDSQLPTTDWTWVYAEDLQDLVFVPDENASGKNYASLEFVLADNATELGAEYVEQGSHVLTFDVLPVNDAPQGKNAKLTIKEDATYTFSAKSFGFSDGDGNHLSKVIIDKFSGDGDLLLGHKAVKAGQVIKASDLGKLTFAGDHDDFGQAYASIKFRVVDDGGTANGGANTDLTANTLVFDVKAVTDRFTGKAGKDTLVGTIGHDILDGKAGNDRLTGKGGSDTFVFKTGYDKDVITDFTAKGAAHDILDIRALTSVSNYADLVSEHMKETKAGIVIDGLHGDVITLQHVRFVDLNADHFLI